MASNKTTPVALSVNSVVSKQFRAGNISHHDMNANSQPATGLRSNWLSTNDMSTEQPRYPLHGISLRVIVEDLVHRRGFDDLASHIHIRCFSFDPSIKSSLKFLRKTTWARKRVEQLYLDDHPELTPLT